MTTSPSLLETLPELKTLPKNEKRFPLCLFLALALSFLHQQASAQTIDLGTASDFSVLAGAGITVAGAVNTTKITGNIGTFPTTSISGLGNVVLNGVNHAGDAVTQIAKGDLVTAYGTAAGRAATVTYAPASDLGGLTLLAGVYKNSTSFGITGTLTLDAAGNPNAVWIFQAGSTLTTASSSNVILINGAQGCHVFWQVGSSATLGTNSSFTGNILALTDITATTSASVYGRLLAQTGAVTLDTNDIVLAICEVLVNGSETTNKKGGANAASVAAVKNALALASRVLDVISVTGLTSVYTLGISQFDSEVFGVQQRLADIRAVGRAVGVRSSMMPDAPSGARAPGEKNSWGGKSSWAGKGGEGVQPEQVQMSDDDRWGFFITGTGDFSTAGDTNSAGGFHGNSFGTALGVDCQLTDHFVLGVSLGYTHSDIDLTSDGKLKADGGKAAVYGMYHRGNFYTEGLIGGGYNSYDTQRSAVLGRALGNATGGQFDAYAGLGYDIKLGRFTVTPMASLLYTLVGINGFDERSLLEPLHVESQQESSLRSRVGPRVAFSSRVGSAIVTPSFSAQWQHEFLNDQFPLDASFASDAGSVFTVQGPNFGRDSALLTAALNIQWSRYAAYLAYQADLGRKNYENQTVLAGFRVGW